MKNTKVIAVANQKGGVAKTTTVINVGTALALKGYKVLLMDFDPQESLSNFLGIYGAEKNIGTAMYNVINKNEFDIAEYITKNEKNGVYIIPSELNTMNRLEKDLISVRSKETVLRKVIKKAVALDEFDFIFVDCLASLNVMLDNALTASDKVLIPCQAAPLSYAAVPNLLLQIDDIKNDLNDSLEVIGIVATMCERSNNSKQTLDMLYETYPELMFASKIDRMSVAANSAITEKACVLSNAKDNKVSAEYRALADEIIERV
jgi:chromosome partitioning protein